MKQDNELWNDILKHARMQGAPGVTPIWVSCEFSTIASKRAIIIDWNNKAAVRAFAALANFLLPLYWTITTTRVQPHLVQ